MLLCIARFVKSIPLEVEIEDNDEDDRDDFHPDKSCSKYFFSGWNWLICSMIDQLPPDKRKSHEPSSGNEDEGGSTPERDIWRNATRKPGEHLVRPGVCVVGDFRRLGLSMISSTDRPLQMW